MPILLLVFLNFYLKKPEDVGLDVFLCLFCSGSSVRGIFLESLFEPSAPWLLRGLEFFGVEWRGLDSQCAVRRLSILMLQFCSYVYVLSQRINLKKSQCPISILVPSFLKSLLPSFTKCMLMSCRLPFLLDSFDSLLVPPATYCSLLQSSHLQLFPLLSHPVVLKKPPIIAKLTASTALSLPVEPVSEPSWRHQEALSVVTESRGFWLGCFAPVLSNCSGSLCWLPGQHICCTGRALQQGF